MKKVTATQAQFLNQFSNVSEIDAWLKTPQGTWFQISDSPKAKTFLQSLVKVKAAGENLDMLLAQFIRNGIFTNMFCKNMRVHVVTAKFELSFPVGTQTKNFKHQTITA